MAWIDTFLADKTRRKVVVTGVIAGGAALAAGFGRAVDKKFPGYKRTSDLLSLYARCFDWWNPISSQQQLTLLIKE